MQATGLKTPAGPSLIHSLNAQPVHLVLAKDLARSVRAGHPWLFSEAFERLPPAAPGSIALIKNKAGDIIAKGIYDPTSPIPFRSMAVMKERLDPSLVAHRVERAAAMRSRMFPDPNTTNGFRLFNGEGDGLPGLVCDIYAHAAVLKLDGPGSQGFYNTDAIAEWLVARFPHIRTVYLKNKSGSEVRGRLLRGEDPNTPVVFRENGALFKAILGLTRFADRIAPRGVATTITVQVDIVMGQKTGFFLDQRHNRATVGRLCTSHQGRTAGVRMLNVFGYTGGFSIYAGRAGAERVTTVDLAPVAIEFAEQNWDLNGLNAHRHNAQTADAFAFLEAAASGKERWDVVVVDPPSFAPNKQSVDKARASYERVFSLAARVVAPNGVIALASCSSHITPQVFGEICSSALALARRRSYCLMVAGQPEDHPFPTAAEELRYLKFNAYQLEGG